MRRLPRYRRVTEMLAQADRILFDEIEARRADPDLEERAGHPLDARRRPLRGRLRMSDAELRDQLMTLLMAGHETTATGLAWAFDLLFRAPEKLSGCARRSSTEGPRLPATR